MLFRSSEAGTLWQEPMIEEDILAAKRPKSASRGPPSDQDGSDSEAVTLWQEPMIEEDILAAKRPKSASHGSPSDQDGSNSEAGTLWQEPMIEEDILATKRPKSASHGPPLTVKIDGQFPLPQWGGRTPTTRQLLLEQFKSEGTFQDSSWASRPSPEEILDRLKDFFPDHDLDEPTSGMPSIPDSPSAKGSETPAPKRTFLSWLTCAVAHTTPLQPSSNGFGVSSSGRVILVASTWR